jgi:hypothetical protein
MSKRDQCWKLIDVDHGPLPVDYPAQLGTIAKFATGKPVEAAWNPETSCWVAMRWAKCDDPSSGAR